jgi:hypothetical protein
LLPTFERLDDDHLSAAARARRASIDRFDCVSILWRNIKQLAGQRDAGLARGCGEQAIVPDAVEAARQAA